MTAAQRRELRDRLLPAGKTEVSLSSISKDWRQIVKGARKVGWVVYINGSGHIQFRGPDGQDFSIATTGKMYGRTGKNYRAIMRRNGVPGA